MTQEEKQILLKDISARLPYGVVINCSDDDTNCNCFLTTDILHEIQNGYEYYDYKPYLRPMSSMTEEEKKEYHAIDSRAYTCPEDIAHIPAADRIDWLNKKGFDYRGLIPMGLALEALEGMYKTEPINFFD